MSLGMSLTLLDKYAKIILMKGVEIMNEEFLTKKELADIYTVSQRTINRWMVSGVPYNKTPGGHVRFNLYDVVSWHDKTKEGESN